MTVVFNKTIHFAPFGDNQVEKYSEGKAYTSRGAHEAKMFDYYIEQGYAVRLQAESRPLEIETKIETPKAKK
jgi:hypothetical protein